MPSSSDQTRVGRTLTLGGGAESSLEGRDIELSVSPKDIHTSPYDLCANRSDRRQSREGDRWFESTSLRRRVCHNAQPLNLVFSRRANLRSARTSTGSYIRGPVGVVPLPRRRSLDLPLADAL